MGNKGKKKKIIIIGCTVILLGVASVFTYSMVAKNSSSDTSKEIAQEDTEANENEEATNNADNVSSEEQANNEEQPSNDGEASAEVKEEPKEEEASKDEQQAENTEPIEEKGPSNFNAVEGDESYNPEDDKNHDGIIDLYDLVLDSNK